jgi:hypothetical protein
MRRCFLSSGRRQRNKSGYLPTATILSCDRSTALLTTKIPSAPVTDVSARKPIQSLGCVIVVSASGGPLLPIQQVLCEVGSLIKTEPIMLDARLSHLDPLAEVATFR